MNNIGVFLENEVYPRLDRAKVFAALEPVERGDKLVMRCPGCGKREAYVYRDKFRLRCSREGNCGYNVTMAQYVVGSADSPRGKQFVDAVRILASIAGVTFEERQQTLKELEFIAKAQEIETKLEQFLDACQPLSPQCKGYLKQRGFVQESFPVEMGAVGHTAESFLMSNPSLVAKTTDDAGYIIGSWKERLIIPIRDRRGRLRGVIGRDITDKHNIKYLNTANLPFDKIALVGLDVALSNNNRDITIMEGVLDVFSLRAHGHWQATATGGAFGKLTSDCWELLAGFGVRSATLFTDNDDAGRKALLTSLDNADRAKSCPEIYVVDPELLGQHKDPDSYVREHGIQAFHELAGTAMHAYRYRAKKFAEGLSFDRDRERDIYLGRCIDYDASFTDKRKIQKLAEHFWDEVKHASNADIDQLLDLRDDMRERTIRAKQNFAISEALREINPRAAQGDAVGTIEAFTAHLERIKNIESEPRVEPMRSVAEMMDDAYDRWKRNVGKDYLGLRSGQETLDSSLFGIRGFGILGARANVGKTTELCGLALGALRNHPDTCCVFYSLEMAPEAIVDRFANYVTATDWRALQSDKAEKYEEARLSARLELRKSIGERLLVVDRKGNLECDASKMLRQIAAWKAHTGCERVLVIVDYIDVLDLANDYGGNERLLEKKQIEVMQIVSDAIGKDNAVIGVSEVRKGTSKSDPVNDPITAEDLSGTNRKGYAADWILLMNPLTNLQLIERFEFDEDNTYYPVTKLPEPKTFEDKELKMALKNADKIRRAQANQGLAYGEFSIVKARDGGRRHNWFYTSYYTQSRIVEGIQSGMAGMESAKAH